MWMKIYDPRIQPAFGASGGVMVSKLDKQTYTSEFESHWVPLSYGLVPHLSKSLVNFQNPTSLKRLNANIFSVNC